MKYTRVLLVLTGSGSTGLAMPAHVGEARNPAARAVAAMPPSVPTKVMVYVAFSGGVMSTPKAPDWFPAGATGDAVWVGDNGGVGEGRAEPEPGEGLQADDNSRANNSDAECLTITSVNDGLFNLLRGLCTSFCASVGFPVPSTL